MKKVKISSGYKRTIWRKATFAMAKKNLLYKQRQKSFTKGKIYKITHTFWGFRPVSGNIQDSAYRYGISSNSDSLFTIIVKNDSDVFHRISSNSFCGWLKYFIPLRKTL